MTYFYKHYEWTAFKEADLLKKGDTDFSRGDSFVMSAPTVKMATYDNDAKLSGGLSWWGGYSSDRMGQDALVDGKQVGGKMFAERYHVLKGSDGKTYYLIEIQIEGHDAPGAGTNYLTFYGAQPKAGVTLTSQGSCDVAGSWIDYSSLGAGKNAPPNTPPSFTNVPKDGVFCIDENTKLVVDLDAKDKDGDALSFSIVGGADNKAFTIDAKTGVLSFKNAPDYEKPTDSDGNNIYKVIVQVADGKGGTEVKELSVQVKDVAEDTPKCIVIEAEDMQLCNYKVGSASSASGGEYIVLGASWWGASSGYAQTKFNGAAGEYDFTIRVWDAAQGNATVKVLVNGKQVGTITLNAKKDGWVEKSIDGLTLKKGDVIKLEGYGSGCDYAIIDKIKICPVEPAPKPGALEGRVFHDVNKDGLDNDGANGIAGVTVQLLNAAGVVVATQLTAADGGYAFTNLQPGDYSVVFPTNVNGRPLTQQDIGGDDSIDSDASTTTGQTGSYTVVAGETVYDVDAGVIDPNQGPVAVNDQAGVCAGEAVAVDVLANDSDADGDQLTITKVAGQAIAEGESVTLTDGVIVSLVAGQLVFDSANSDYAGLLIGQKDSATYSYEITDGNGGVATANVDLDFCGSVNTLETIKASLPAGGTLVVATDNSPGGDFYTVTISDTGDARFDGKSFDIAYCVSAYEAIGSNVQIPYSFYMASEESVPAGIIAYPENLDMVNWILNQDFASMDNGDGNGKTYTEAEIQGAIWGLTDNIVFVQEVYGYGTTQNAQEIYDMAQAQGGGYVPGAGDIVGLILDPTAEAEAAGNKQPLIIGVNFDDLAQDCLCY